MFFIPFNIKLVADIVSNERVKIVLRLKIIGTYGNVEIKVITLKNKFKAHQK